MNNDADTVIDRMNALHDTKFKKLLERLLGIEKYKISHHNSLAIGWNLLAGIYALPEQGLIELLSIIEEVENE